MAGSLALRASDLRVRKMLLQTMPADLVRELAGVNEQNGSELAASIAKSAPISEDDNPGQLKGSVRYEVGEGGKKVTVMAGGGDASHATYVEFGTRKMGATAFFWPTFRLLRKRLYGRYGRALGKVAKKFSA